MSERQTIQNPEQHNDTEKLKEVAHERSVELAKERERSAEKSPESNLEQARHEALERATSKERKKDTEEREVSPEKPQRATKRQRDASFDTTMSEVRQHMSQPSQQFSRLIHNKAVERVSDTVGGTIARPNAILSGSVIAFLFTLAIYLIARFNGYPLSGSETIAAFILGWAIGLIYDYLRLIVTGKK
jgi:preprotein translocase subunit SecF